MASPIFHLATAADWEAARASGRYTTSTRGRTLAEEGFVHASRADQWQGVRERYYADVTEPLVLLVIDPERLTAPVVEEPVPGGTETFPHVYGAIDAAAVTRVVPLDRPGATPAAPPVTTPATTQGRTPGAAPGGPPRTFASLFLEELAVRAAAGVGVIVVAVGLGLVVVATVGALAGLLTIVVLLVAGVLVTARVLGRRSARLARAARAGTPEADSQA